MDHKKIKKGSGGMMGILVSIVVVIGIFMAFFHFYSEQISNNGQQMDPKYNDTYTKLNTIESQIDENVNEVKTSANEVREADSGIMAAINGFKGLGKSMILLLGFTSQAVDTSDAVLSSADIIPSWLQSLIKIILIALVVFVVLDILLGRTPIVK